MERIKSDEDSRYVDYCNTAQERMQIAKKDEKVPEKQKARPRYGIHIALTGSNIMMKISL